MTDILFTHSYFLRFDPKEYRTMMPYPPLGTITAASYIREKGFSVAFHDVMLSESEDEILLSLKKFGPKLVVIYDDNFNYLTKMCLSRMREAAFRLAKHAKEYGCTVIVFSSDSVDHLEKYFEHDIDYVMCGEAEITLEELAGTLIGNSGKEPEHIAGLAFVKDGAIHQTGQRKVIRNLDMLPFPAWELVDVEMYRKIWKERHGYFSVNISTTRGCPFHCNWCAKPLYGQVYNSRSPENVVEEMKFLKESVNPDHLWITDDIFGLKPGWVPRFAEIVERENAQIPFKCLSRTDLLLKHNTVDHLKKAGCQTVWIGAESGSQKILDAMEKGTTIAQIYEATKQLHNAGIRVGYFMQFGYPGETREDIENTLRMVRDCQPDEIGISVSYPLPGTKFYDGVKSQLEEKQNWVTSEDFDPMFAATYSRDFYRTLHKVVHKKFSIWRGMSTLKQFYANPFSPDKKSLRSIASMIYHGSTLPIHTLRLGMLEHQES